MTGEPDPGGEARDWLAAEYALGLLEGDLLAEARRRLSDDPDFRREVGEWTGRLAPLLDEVAPAAPPEDLWRRIAPRLAGAGGPAAAHAPAANDNLAPLQRKLALWRGYAAAATALAASLAFFLAVRPGEPPVPSAPTPVAPVPAAGSAPLVAMMESKDSPVRLVATYEPASRSLVVMPAAGLARAAGHSHQLWLIPAGGAPHPLGIVTPDTPLRLALSGALAPDATLAVSVEPTGGSPTGLPTGPVIASGKLVRT